MKTSTDRKCGIFVTLALCLLLPCAAFGRDAFLRGGRLTADYDSELRGSDGRVDVPLLVCRLKEIRVDTYFYLIWHRETDWEDLKLFLPAAREAGIDVWAYLVPPSESPPLYGSRYSEPFRLDYIRWGEEIARLSLAHPNLKAFVIDDFWTNRSFFTPDYVKAMRDAARAVNPEMRFLPLMYYRQIDLEFVEGYRDVIDGTVVAYPEDAETVRRAWRVLNDREDIPGRWRLSYPGQTRSSPGDFVALSRRLRVVASGRYTVRLQQRDDYAGPTAGYHFKQCSIDGRVVWEEDVAGGDRTWQEAAIDVTPQVKGKPEVELALRAYDRKGVSNFGVGVEMQEPAFEGLAAVGEWVRDGRGRWDAAFAPAYKGEGRFHIPLVVMVAGNRSQFAKRWGEPVTAGRVRDKVKMAVVQMRQGYAEGMVTYCLPKSPGDGIYDAVRRLFLKVSTSASADFDGSGTVDFEDFLLFARAFGTEVGEYATVEAAFDLDLDGSVGFGDFLLFARAYRK